MTDPMELVGRLESRSDTSRRIGKDALANDLTEAAACIREMVEWRPIETAPRGTDSLGPILVVYGEDTPSYHVAYEGWTEDDGTIAWFNGDVRVYPTHWLPLPPAPGAEA